MATIKKIQAPATQQIIASEAYLQRKHNELSAFTSVEHLVVDGEDVLEESTYNGLVHHILSIRSELARTLWQTEAYVGVSIIDELVFQSAKNAPGQVCQNVLSYLTKSQVGRPGFVLYPLHGLGIEQPPLLRKDPQLRPYIHFRKMAVCLAPQTNSFEEASKRVSEMASKLGVVGKIDPSDLHHFAMTGPMEWFTRNPLMMVKIASHTGAYYENQFVYTLKIRTAAALAAMLYAIGADRGHKVNKFVSSASINNWETLNIRHYLIGEARHKRSDPVDLRRVPMNVAALDLARLSDLSLSLSSKTLEQAFLKSAQQRLVAALKVVEGGHLVHVNMKSRDPVRARIFARIITALDWYRQSFSARVTDDEAVVALAVAYETLLTDFYSSGVSARIKRRIGICLKGKHGIRSYQDAVISVMYARGAIVHNGSSVQEAEIIKAQAGFAYCFEAIIERLPNAGTIPQPPIATILGD